MKRVLLLIMLAACSLTSHATSTNELFADKPYTLNLDLLQALDPKPLQVSSFKPEPAEPERVQGIHIISGGRIYPFTYEVISVRNPKPGILETLSKTLDGKSDIILKNIAPCSLAEQCLHYFERISVDGKPHHATSNYLLVKNQTLYHFSAANYAALINGYESWGAPTENKNAELEVGRLLQAISFKNTKAPSASGPN
ncbi:hypothetical protein [Chromobacterium sp. IIBBL 290-4]|uniref:hypothetical protein n=1 Tax=Chromobacterium sp. IIBBL 290-4 TaxID=2953890 RepID=UPI0020B83F60|nr:hypothetical protein [Chromobacterium sp. IIBBL 290-4]UTH74748.1 hypothetical protein NKT35_01150 [Chromobacterium sp. IIBBL 290-4]